MSSCQAACEVGKSQQWNVPKDPEMTIADEKFNFCSYMVTVKKLENV